MPVRKIPVMCAFALFMGTLALSCLVASFGAVEAATLATFKVQDAYVTYAEAINSTNTVVGFFGSYSGSGGKFNAAFLRAPDGTITKFRVPGAKRTGALGINEAGAIAGIYFDSKSVAHGFLRDPSGTITAFDPPGIGTGFNQGTSPTSINEAGSVAGGYTDANDLIHSFIRTSDGQILTFDPPGTQSSIIYGINGSGAVAGTATDAGNVNHGFVRTSDGTVTIVDAVGAGVANGEGTFAFAINDEDEIVGYYVDANHVDHGFLRTSDGTITEFDAPGKNNTIAKGINNQGEITGIYSASGGPDRGFLRRNNGTFIELGLHATPPLSLFPVAINDQGAIAGILETPQDTLHADRGFLRLPSVGPNE